MRILLVGQFFPPYQTPRSFRLYELARELAKGNSVTVYALLGDYNYTSMQKETGITIKSLGRSRFGNEDSTGHKKRSLINATITHTVGKWLLFPSIELKHLVYRAIKQEFHQIDLIISIAYPHPVHWGVMKAKKEALRNGEVFPKWISDCGDPFMGNVFAPPPSYFARVEKEWGIMTDFITIPVEQARKAYYDDVQDKIRVIPQGFCLERRFDRFSTNDVLTFVFAGNAKRNLRDPDKFLKYLATKTIPFVFHIYTRDISFYSPYKALLGEKLSVHPFVSREEILEILSKADFLVDIANEGSVQKPSKLIDYAIAGRPILEVSSSFHEASVVDEFLIGDYRHAMPPIDLTEFDIKTVARKFLMLD